MSELHQAGSGDALLSVRGLKTYFPVYGGLFATKQGYVQAVNNVSFDVHCGETLGLVGRKWLRQKHAGADNFAHRACDRRRGLF